MLVNTFVQRTMFKIINMYVTFFRSYIIFVPKFKSYEYTQLEQIKVFFIGVSKKKMKKQK